MKSKIALFIPSYYLLFSVVIILFSSCNDPKVISELIITEPAGIARNLEYVEVKIPTKLLHPKNKALFLRNKKDGNLVKIQILNGSKDLKDSSLVQCLFPISIGANETHEYDIVIGDTISTATDLISKGEGLNLSIENEYYLADLASRNSYNNEKLAPGQLTSLVLKKYNGITLERGNINMHWAPNFQKKGMEYKTMGHIQEFDSINIEKGPYMISVYRSGKVKGYEEIQVEGEYKFYAGKPYFSFSSKMTMMDSLTVIMLKNDEMTMDRFFTHAIFPLASEKIKTVPLYDTLPLIPHYSIKELRKTPIETNTKWFGFYNDSIKYGFGSLRMRFDYKNSDGGMSPMIDEQTKITYAHNEGRYWDRRFVDTTELRTPKGSKYFEENVYAIFEVNSEQPSKELENLYKQLSNPVIVKCNPIIN